MVLCSVLEILLDLGQNDVRELLEVSKVDFVCLSELVSILGLSYLSSGESIDHSDTHIVIVTHDVVKGEQPKVLY